jgi:hypothetical protein
MRNGVLRAWLFGLSSLHALAIASPVLSQPAREWPAYATLVSGQNTFCSNGGPVLIVEGEGTFTAMTRNKKLTGWSVPMAADGSARADTKSAFVNRPVRIVVPAGTAPRTFETVDLSQACRFRFDPDPGRK